MIRRLKLFKGANSFTESDVRNALFGAGMPMQLILNLTEDCNFRCEYCCFSEVYQFSRNRTNARMSRQVAIKALDYFFDLVRPIGRQIPGKDVAVTFYGGEPLLEAPLLMELIDYAQCHCPLSLTFSVTTNESLLTNEVMDFLRQQ